MPGVRFSKLVFMLNHREVLQSKLLHPPSLRLRCEKVRGLGAKDPLVGYKWVWLEGGICQFDKKNPIWDDYLRWEEGLPDRANDVACSFQS